jgi:hypothetical protein
LYGQKNLQQILHMKIVKLSLGILFLSTALFTSCKKCANCTQTATTSVNVSTPGYPQTSQTTFEACGDDLKAVDGKTTTSTASSGSITATTTATTVCN